MDDTSGRVARQKQTAGWTGDAPPRTDQTLPEETDRRARELRAEIAETRGEMSETIEAIQERLTPRNIATQAGESVRNAATEKVKQMANTAGDAMDRVLGSSFMDTVRANPVPAALIGVGAAWLLAKRRTEDGSNDYGRGGYRSPESLRGSGADSDDYSGGYRSADREISYGGPNYGTVGTRGTFEAAPDGNLASRAQDIAGDVRDAARRTGYRAQLQFDDVLQNNPLALGAAAAIIGAVVGMSVPQTDTENQLMGDARDTVVDRARGLASEAADRVSEAAGNVENLASHVKNEAKATASQPDQQWRPASSAAWPSEG